MIEMDSHALLDLLQIADSSFPSGQLLPIRWVSSHCTFRVTSTSSATCSSCYRTGWLAWSCLSFGKHAVCRTREA